MKVLLCHNYYREPGGEDQVFNDEKRLLEKRGVDVVCFERHSRLTETMRSWKVARSAVWSSETYEELRALIRHEQPDVMHCTNIFPLISPAAYDAAHDEGVPVVQSLHNFRSVCANGLLMRDGAACEACIDKAIPWPAVMHGCYRDSRLASAVMAGSIGWQKTRRSQRDAVSVHVALSEFSRERFIRGGFAADRIVVKPNFVDPDPGAGEGFGGYAVFVGRLSSEKGLDVLIEAWRDLPHGLRLKIIGDGPLAESVSRAQDCDPRIEWLGRRSNHEILDLMGDAELLILPSICYENCPKVILEAYSRGTPVVASRLGAMAEYVRDKQTGLTFETGQADDLIQKIDLLLSDPEYLLNMRLAARAEYEKRYTAEANFRMLIEIYGRALGRPLEEFTAERQPATTIRAPLTTVFPDVPIVNPIDVVS